MLNVPGSILGGNLNHKSRNIALNVFICFHWPLKAPLGVVNYHIYYIYYYCFVFERKQNA